MCLLVPTGSNRILLIQCWLDYRFINKRVLINYILARVAHKSWQNILQFISFISSKVEDYFYLKFVLFIWKFIYRKYHLPKRVLSRVVGIIHYNQDKLKQWRDISLSVYFVQDVNDCFQWFKIDFLFEFVLKRTVTRIRHKYKARSWKRGGLQCNYKHLNIDGSGARNDCCNPPLRMLVR